MEQKFCQSCGMPLTDEILGTNADGSKNEDYCIYCYKDGKFLQDCTMDEMIAFCAQFVDEVNKNLPSPSQKRSILPRCRCTSRSSSAGGRNRQEWISSIIS